VILRGDADKHVAGWDWRKMGCGASTVR